jgi:hypothetical protein
MVLVTWKRFKFGFQRSDELIGTKQARHAEPDITLRGEATP